LPWAAVPIPIAADEPNDAILNENGVDPRFTASPGGEGSAPVIDTARLS
jgi:hypothetical protein